MEHTILSIEEVKNFFPSNSTFVYERYGDEGSSRVQVSHREAEEPGVYDVIAASHDSRNRWGGDTYRLLLCPHVDSHGKHARKAEAAPAMAMAS